MKIPLKLGMDGQPTAAAAAAEAILRDVRAFKDGNWNAKNSLARTFHPLLISLAEKRSHHDRAKTNLYMDAGKEGLFRAAKKYKPKSDGGNFQVFALDFIETAMDQVDRKRGFFSRLFGS